MRRRFDMTADAAAQGRRLALAPAPGLVVTPSPTSTPFDPALLAMVEAMPVPALLLDPADLRPVAANAEAARLLAVPTAGATAVTRAWGAILGHSAAGLDLAARLLAPSPEPFPVTLAAPGQPARPVTLRVRAVAVAGRPLLSVALLEPLQRDALTIAQRRLEVALAGADLGAWHWDIRTGHLEVTARWATMLGLAPPTGPLRVTDWAGMVHPDDRPVVRALLDRHLVADIGPYEAEFRMRHADGRWVPILARGQAIERDATGQAVVMTGTHLDLSDIHQAQAALLVSEREARRRLAELEHLYRSAPLGLGQMDCRLRFVRINEALAAINGVSPEAHLGRSVWDIVPNLRGAAEPLLRRVLDHGETISGIAFSGQTAKAPGVPRDWEEQFYPVRDPETQAIIGVGIVCEEVTERKRADRTRDLLLRELDHRVKNLFAVIGGLVTFTAREAPSPAAMRDALLGRVDALALAHDILRPAMAGGLGPAAPPTAQVGLGALLAKILAPFQSGDGQPDRVRFTGPDVPLGLVAAPPVALALHELATNAAKYGALSVEGGAVDLAWRVDGPSLRIAWTEQGGPPVAPPRQGGFGHRLVTQSAAQLGGRVEFAWGSGGLGVAIRLPLARLAG